MLCYDRLTLLEVLITIDLHCSLRMEPWVG